MTPIRIVLVDDHCVVRAGLRLVIESRPGMQVVGEASNCREALAAAATSSPDLVLLDLDLDGEDGLALVPDLATAAPGAHVLVLTGVRDPDVHRRAVLGGAMGLVLKDRAAETVIKAIEKVHAGEIWFDRALIADVLRERIRPGEAHEDPEAAKIATLTGREREVIALIGEGLRNREIGDRLAIAEPTVRHHLTSIFGKLGVTDRTELLIYAYKHKLLTPE